MTFFQYYVKKHIVFTIAFWSFNILSCWPFCPSFYLHLILMMGCKEVKYYSKNKNSLEALNKETKKNR